MRQLLPLPFNQRLSAKEHRVLDMLARTGKIDWHRVHANTVNALKRKGLVDGRRVTRAGQAARAAIPNIFDDLFAEHMITDAQIRALQHELFKGPADARQLHGLVDCHDALGRSHRRSSARERCAALIVALRRDA